ncbi:hypothetical protein [Deinococcus multiflagellatus]|uniref:Uncharacterized protein n=1 Tax=Deinococcus multiflagellatus TaxID=1656887 RepID=A0ABW1ZV48_9DEIO
MAWEEARSVVVTLGMTLLAASVSVGIAMNQLRRVPALISGAIGVSGGGESSGTGTNPMRGLAEAAGVTALAKTVQARAVSSAADRLGLGKSSGSQGQPGGKSAGAPGSPTAPGDPKSSAGGSGAAAGPAAAAGGPARPPEAEGAAYGRSHTQGQGPSQPTTSARIASTLASTPAGRLAAAQHLTAAAGRATGRAAQTVANVTGDRALLDRVGGMASAGAANTQAAMTAARTGLGHSASAARDLVQNAQTQGLPQAVSNAVMSSAPATNVQLGLQARTQRLAAAAKQPTAAGQTFAAAAAHVAPTAPGAVPQAPSAAAGAATGPVPSGKGASVPPPTPTPAAPAPTLNRSYSSGPTSRSTSTTPTVRSGQFRQAVQVGQEPRPSGLKDFKSGVSANLKPAQPSEAPGKSAQPMTVDAARSEATTAELPQEETT